MTGAAAEYVVESHDGGVHVWPSALVNLGNPERKKLLHCTCTCFKVQMSDI